MRQMPSSEYHLSCVDVLWHSVDEDGALTYYAMLSEAHLAVDQDPVRADLRLI